MWLKIVLSTLIMLKKIVNLEKQSLKFTLRDFIPVELRVGRCFIDKTVVMGL